MSPLLRGPAGYLPEGAVQLDNELVNNLRPFLGLSPAEVSTIKAKRLFLASADGGMGDHRVELEVPAAHAASCRFLPARCSRSSRLEPIQQVHIRAITR